MEVHYTRAMTRSLWSSNIICKTVVPRVFDLTNRVSVGGVCPGPRPSGWPIEKGKVYAYEGHQEEWQVGYRLTLRRARSEMVVNEYVCTPPVENPVR
jgi:hypothetical protein